MDCSEQPSQTFAFGVPPAPMDQNPFTTFSFNAQAATAQRAFSFNPPQAMPPANANPASSFSFGSAAQNGGAAAFSFNAPPAAAPSVSLFKSIPSLMDLKPDVSHLNLPQQGSASTAFFNSGAAPMEPTPSAFSFQPKPAAETGAAAASFSFARAFAPAEPTPSFSFQVPSAPSAPTSAFTSFSFARPAASAPTEPQPTTAFSFAAPTTTAASSFSFARAAVPTEPTPASVTKPSAPATAAASFSFATPANAAPVEPKPTPSFSFNAAAAEFKPANGSSLHAQAETKPKPAKRVSFQMQPEPEPAAASFSFKQPAKESRPGEDSESAAAPTAIRGNRKAQREARTGARSTKREHGDDKAAASALDKLCARAYHRPAKKDAASNPAEYMNAAGDAPELPPRQPQRREKLAARITRNQPKHAKTGTKITVNKSPATKPPAAKISARPVSSGAQKRSALLDSRRTFADAPEVASILQSLRSLIGRVCNSDYEKFQVLDERDKLLCRMRALNPALFSRVGTCVDFCPEKERYMKISQRQVAPYECLPNGSPDHTKLTKEYTRSAADQEQPLPHELRPDFVLLQVKNFLLVEVVDCRPNVEQLPGWYNYIWSRTRAIRKEITQQNLVSKHSVELVELCVRFHTYCGYALGELDVSRFDPNMNTENLGKSIQTLRHHYDDLAKQGVQCENEAEFRAYDILLNLHDSNTLSQTLRYRPEIRDSEPVRLALQLAAAFQNTNYARFFKLARSQLTFLQACMCHRYFNKLRFDALANLKESSSRESVYPMSRLIRILGFDNESQALVAAEHLGLRGSRDGLVMNSKMTLNNTVNSMKAERYAWIDAKQAAAPLSLLLNNGLDVSKPLFENLVSSFEDNTYAVDNVTANILEQVRSGSFKAKPSENNLRLYLMDKMALAKKRRAQKAGLAITPPHTNATSSPEPTPEAPPIKKKAEEPRPALFVQPTSPRIVFQEQPQELSVEESTPEIPAQLREPEKVTLVKEVEKRDDSQLAEICQTAGFHIFHKMLNSISSSVLLNVVEKAMHEALKSAAAAAPSIELPAIPVEPETKAQPAYSPYYEDELPEYVDDVDETVATSRSSRSEEQQSDLDEELAEEEAIAKCQEVRERMHLLWQKQFVDQWRRVVAMRKRQREMGAKLVRDLKEALKDAPPIDLNPPDYFPPDVNEFVLAQKRIFKSDPLMCMIMANNFRRRRLRRVLRVWHEKAKRSAALKRLREAIWSDVPATKSKRRRMTKCTDSEDARGVLNGEVQEPVVQDIAEPALNATYDCPVPMDVGEDCSTTAAAATSAVRMFELPKPGLWLPSVPRYCSTLLPVPMCCDMSRLEKYIDEQVDQRVKTVFAPLNESCQQMRELMDDVKQEFGLRLPQ